MALHALWTALWLIFGLVGFSVASFTGMVWGIWFVDSGERAFGQSGWPIIVTPLCWLIGAAWGIFALVQAIFEFIQAVTAVGAALPG